jgi:hypothetical protein
MLKASVLDAADRNILGPRNKNEASDSTLAEPLEETRLREKYTPVFMVLRRAPVENWFNIRRKLITASRLKQTLVQIAAAELRRFASFSRQSK